MALLPPLTRIGYRYQAGPPTVNLLVFALREGIKNFITFTSNVTYCFKITY